MLKQLHVTFGSKEILKAIAAEFPNHQFATFASNDVLDSHLQMIDITGGENVFKSGVTYDVKNYHGSTDWHGFFNYNFLTIYPEYLNLFESRINQWFATELFPGMKAIYLLKQANTDNNTYVVLTVWDSPQSWQRWKKSNEFFFSNYANTSENKFHETNYEFRNITN